MLSNDILFMGPAEWSALSPEEKRAQAESRADELLPAIMHREFRRVLGQRAVTEYEAIQEFIALTLEALRRRIPSG